MGIIQKLFGTHSEHELKRIYPIVDKIEALRPSMQALTDEQLRAKTDEFKKRLADGETLDDILPEAFATVREAAKRAIGMEHLYQLFRHTLMRWRARVFMLLLSMITSLRVMQSGWDRFTASLA